MSSNKEKYRQFLLENEDHTVFNNIWWLDIVCKKWDVILMENEGKIIDAMPYQIEQKSIFTLVRPPLMTPYLANVNFSLKDNLPEFLIQLPKADELMLTTFPTTIDQEKIESLGYIIRKKPTYILDLKNKEFAIMDFYHPDRKREVRKGEKELSVKEEIVDFTTLISHHKNAFELKGGRYPYDEGFLSSLIKESIKNNAAYVATCYFEEQAVAYIWCVYDQHSMYYLIGAINRSQSVNGAMTFLIHKAIMKARELGLKYFDFEGSSEEGIAKFFRKFGGTMHYYYILEKTNNPLWKLKKKIVG